MMSDDGIFLNPGIKVKQEIEGEVNDSEDNGREEETSIWNDFVKEPGILYTLLKKTEELKQPDAVAQEQKPEESAEEVEIKEEEIDSGDHGREEGSTRNEIVNEEQGILYRLLKKTEELKSPNSLATAQEVEESAEIEIKEELNDWESNESGEEDTICNEIVKEEPGILYTLLKKSEELKPPDALGLVQEPEESVKEVEVKEDRGILYRLLKRVEEPKLPDAVDLVQESEECQEAEDEELKPPFAVWVAEEGEETPENAEDQLTPGDEMRASASDKTDPRIRSLAKMPRPSRKEACSVCGKLFSSGSPLVMHLRTHTGERPEKCSVCGKTFARKCSLDVHLYTHTGEKPEKCSVCGKGCAKKNDLVLHMRTHTGEKPEECSECGKRFSAKWCLAEHMWMHRKGANDVESPWKCTICGKGFARKYNLFIHMRTHEGSKQETCSIRKKQFAQKSDLSDHTKNHIECFVCGVKFTTESRLNTHLRTHTGEKQEKCSICGDMFSRKCVLSVHMKTHVTKS